jgi:predicted nucleic acid-binding protein
MVGFVLMITYIVVDTGYLLELFRVPKRFKESDAEEIKRRFSIAKTQLNRLYIPIPVLFELANHIAHIEDSNVRLDLANKLSETVKQGIASENTFFNIIPCAAFTVTSELSNNLEVFVQQFAEYFVKQKLGLTDSAVLLEAQSLKNKNNCVHIWTTDAPLKRYEPDTEPNYFIGSRKK